MKKKILLLAITLALVLTSLTSCRKYYTGWQKVAYNYQTDIVNALNSEDLDAFSALFAQSVASSANFDSCAATLFSMLPPEVTKLSSSLLGSYHGIPHEESGSSFNYATTHVTISANGKKYDIAVLGCFKNPVDSSKIGLLSFYITDNLDKNGNYRGANDLDDWVYGINFDL